MKRTVCAALAATLVLGACATSGTSANTAATERPHRVVDAASKARIDSTLRRFADSRTIAGVSALVYEKGDEVYFSAFGMAQ